jgi:hypothetical protein
MERPMTNKDIRASKDSDLAGSFHAIQRAARSAQELAIRTNTGIVISEGGKNVYISATELVKLHQLIVQENMPCPRN